MHQDVGCEGCGLGIERGKGEEAGSGDESALARSEYEDCLELAQTDSGEECGSVDDGGELERTQPIAVGVTVGRRREVVRVEQDVERVGDESR